MLNRGGTKIKIRYDRNAEKVFVTCWRGGKLVDHGVARVKPGVHGDNFTFQGETFYISEFSGEV